ncbi:hypothetical protein [Rahnella woolbedingensis]|uniref:Uncharacterized protein n=1 Tax=Rahnella woolbedingensis TaxID=1510574 RepID=A0A419NEK9_9GAMM|nr:hypothetical protein [Rahnella woolbedingensis]RJT47194.1 hypothetical protein D6C13_02200 [Rahnella woolbedingensis]
MNLTIKQLCDICDFMGVSVEAPTESDGLDTEVWIGEGVIAGENGEPDYHGLIAHDAEYPEEGAIALEERAPTVTLFCISKTSELTKIAEYEAKGYVVDESSLVNRKVGDWIVMKLKEQPHD